MAKKQNIIDEAKEAIQKAAETVTETVKDVVEDEKTQKIVKQVKQTAEKVADKVQEIIDAPETKEAADALKDAAGKVADAVKAAVSGKSEKIITPKDAKIPEGPLAEKWTNYKAHQKLVNPANKRRLDIIVVGTGLAGASAAASLAEMGFNVLNFCIQDSPRRAHSIAAQGGINAAKNYQNDGDSVYRLFYDTIKGGDYRAREANVYRLAEVSNNIIDQCVAQGVPFARDYGGLLDNRSFGGAQVSRTFYAKGQTGQQLLLGAYSALSRRLAKER